MQGLRWRVWRTLGRSRVRDMTKDRRPSSSDELLRRAKQGVAGSPPVAVPESEQAAVPDDEPPPELVGSDVERLSTPAGRSPVRLGRRSPVPGVEGPQGERSTRSRVVVAVLLVAVIVGVVVALVAPGSDSPETASITAESVTEVPDAVSPTEVGSVGTLTTALDRGRLRCGIDGRSVGFSLTQPDGEVDGFDADFCRAVAAAVFGDANAVEFVPLAAVDRFEAVASGDVDVLFRTTTWTLLRDGQLRMDFGPTTFYDGQQLMGRRSFPLDERSTVADIDGAVVCAVPGTASEQNIAEAASAAGVSVRFEPVQPGTDALEKFQRGACDVMTGDGAGLVGNKAVNDPGDEWVIFPQTPLSREPLGPVYRSDDSLWGDIVSWVVFSTIIAESKGISSTNMTLPPGDSEAARLMGLEGSLAADLGLEGDAFAQVIRQVGNYGEIYERNLAPLGLIRSSTLNDLAENGGLLYAPPIR